MTSLRSKLLQCAQLEFANHQSWWELEALASARDQVKSDHEELEFKAQPSTRYSFDYVTGFTFCPFLAYEALTGLLDLEP